MTTLNQSAMTAATDLEFRTPPLDSVVAILRHAHSAAATLPQVAVAVSDYLDPTGSWSLVRACRTSVSVAVLQRMLVRELLGPPLDPFDREWQFNRSVAVAAHLGKLNAVKWLMTTYAPGYIVSGGAEPAASNGHLHVVKWLHANSDRVWFGLYEKWYAAENGHLETLKWLHMRPPPTSASPDATTQVNDDYYDRVFRCATMYKSNLLTVAGDNGHLDLVKWLAGEIDKWVGERNDASQLRDSDGDQVNPTYTFDMEKTAINGHLDVLQWLHSAAFPWLKMVGRLNTVAAASRNGHVQVVEWIQARFGGEPWISKLGTVVRSGCSSPDRWMYHADGRDWFENALALAARIGRLDLVQWLHRIDRKIIFRGKTARMSSVLQAAVREDYHDVLKLLHQSRWEMYMFTPCAITSAATGGHLGVIQWLQANRKDKCTAQAIINAAGRGFLDIVKWLTANRNEDCTVAAMNSAAREGHLEVVKWLHHHRSEGCTTHAMDSAAARGHLDVVRWLHKNRSEGCTRSAMDEAAVRGHLRTVRWLHKHRTEGCTTRAMDEAASRGYLYVVRWLHENRSEGCTTRAMDGAASAGHLTVLQFLAKHRTEGCTLQAFSGAYNYSHLEVLRWLACHYPGQFDRQQVLQRDIYSHARPYIAEWLRGQL